MLRQHRRPSRFPTPTRRVPIPRSISPCTYAYESLELFNPTLHDAALPKVTVGTNTYVQVLRPFVQRGERIPVPHRVEKGGIAPPNLAAVRCPAASRCSPARSLRFLHRLRSLPLQRSVEWPFYATPRPVVLRDDQKPRTIAYGDESTLMRGKNPTVPLSHFVNKLRMEFPATPATSASDRVCTLTMTFGETEITATAVVVSTGTAATVAFSYQPAGGSGADAAAGIGGAGAGAGARAATGLGGDDEGERSVTPAPPHRSGSGW